MARSSSSSSDSSSSLDSYFASCSEDSDWSSDASSMSTPRKTGTNDLDSHVRSVMDSVLQNELNGNRYEDVTIQEFVQEVWGLAPKLAADILAVEWSLKSSAVATYDTLAQTDAEPKLHAPFREIVDQLLGEMYAHFERTPDDGFWDKRGGYVIKSHYASRKPDILRMWQPVPTEVDSWALVKCIIEFKNVADKAKAKMPSILEHSQDTTSSFASSSQSSLPSAEATTETSDSLPVVTGGEMKTRGAARGRRASSGKAKASKKRTQPSRSASSKPSHSPVASTSKQTSEESLQNLSQPPSTTSLDLALTEPLGKRKRSADDTASRERKRDLKITLNEVQLASYGVECLAVTNRHYVTGIYIDRWMIMLWYYDRHAVLRSEPFNFREKPALLALVMFALSQCNMYHAGFNPIFYKSLPPLLSTSLAMSTALDSEAPSTQTLDVRGTTPSTSFSEMEISSMPTLGTVAPGSEAPDLERPEQEAPEMAPALEAALIDKPIKGLKGCFLMFPPSGSEKKLIPRFRIRKVLSNYYGMIGRGTSVYSVQEVLDTDIIVRDTLLALKMSWQWHFRPAEGGMVSELRKAIPGWADHLPDVKFHTSYQPKDLNLPWTRLDVRKPPQNTIKERYLHVMASKQYSRLWEAGSIEGFKQVFLDCVECHYHAWKEGRILHRDLSETNLMVCLVDNADRSFDQVKGIVNDWDMATKLGEDGNVIRSAALHQTGTAPFMACDLLDEDNPCPHYYRHDLESLFYILAWAAVHYNLENETQHRIAINKGQVLPGLSEWIGKYKQSCKSMFLFHELGKNKIFSHIGPEFKTIQTDWLEPLWELFHEAYIHKPMWNPLDTTYDYATCNGKVTFETFMAAMGVTPRGDSGVFESIPL